MQIGKHFVYRRSSYANPDPADYSIKDVVLIKYTQVDGRQEAKPSINHCRIKRHRPSHRVPLYNMFIVNRKTCVAEVSVREYIRLAWCRLYG